MYLEYKSEVYIRIKVSSSCQKMYKFVKLPIVLFSSFDAMVLPPLQFFFGSFSSCLSLLFSLPFLLLCLLIIITITIFSYSFPSFVFACFNTSRNWMLNHGHSQVYSLTFNSSEWQKFPQIIFSESEGIQKKCFDLKYTIYSSFCRIVLVKKCVGYISNSVSNILFISHFLYRVRQIRSFSSLQDFCPPLYKPQFHHHLSKSTFPPKITLCLEFCISHLSVVIQSLVHLPVIMNALWLSPCEQ